eukprot:910454-Prorocentrum_minimum.AAC.6
MTVNGESAPVESLGNPHTPPAGSAARRLLQTGNNGVVVDLDFEMAVRPPASSEDRTVLLRDVEGLATLGNGVGNVSGTRRNVCGNGVCESGETCHRDMDPGSDRCCEADCPLVLSPCPTGPRGNPMVPCCGRGVCLAGVGGVCDCFPGYEGENCGQCSDHVDELTGELQFMSVFDGQVRRCYIRLWCCRSFRTGSRKKATTAQFVTRLTNPSCSIRS